MKILKLRFKNLNSLSGEWEIDFSDKRFIDDGIFAITGATGTGKSTILDAISLALYAQTPRLGKITKSNNEIMSKGKGECFSEVLFEVNGKKYLVHWYQRRSRKSIDGELQHPKHEISQDGNILEDNLRKVPTKVEEICGLDFDKMRRSMLLAQGSFDIFLKANANERAPLLEEITGTEIYSQISIEVHKRKSEINSIVETLEEKSKDIEILETDQELALNSELTTLSTKNTNIDKELKSLNTIIQNFQTKESIETELKSHKEELTTLEHQIKEFEPKKGDISQIKRAIKIENSYIKLNELNSKHSNKLELLSKNKYEFERIKKELNSINDNKDIKSRKLKEQKQELETQKPLFDEIKKIDIEINHKTKNLKETKQEFEKREKNLQDITLELNNTTKSLKHKTATLKELKQKVEASKKDEKLSQDILLIENNLNRLNANKQALDKLKKEIERDKRVEQNSINQIAKIKQNIFAFENRNKELTNILQVEQTKLNTLLKDSDIIKIQEEITKLNRRREGIKELLNSIKQGQEYKKEIEQINSELKELKSNLADINSKIEVINQQITPLKNQEVLLNENMLLIKEVQSLSEYRNRLKDGKECPLCGSKVHPYAEGNTPIVDDKQEQLQKLKKQIEDLETKLNKQTIYRAKVEQEIESKKEQIVKIELLFSELDSKFKLKLSELNIPKDSVSIKDLKKEDEKLQKQIELWNEKIKAIEKQREVVKQSEIEYEKHKKEYEKIDNMLISEKQKLEILQEKLSAKESKYSELQAEITTLSQELSKTLNYYNLELNESNIISSLQERIEMYRHTLETIQKEELEIAKLNSSLTSFQNQQQIIQNEVNNLKSTLANKEQELIQIKGQRFIKFKDKNPQNEEQKLKQSIDALEKELGKIELLYTDNKSLFDKKESQIESLNIELKSLKIELESAKKEFEKALKEQSFKSKEEFLKSLKRQNELQELESIETKLKEQKERLNALLKDKQIKYQEIENLLKNHNKTITKEKIDQYNQDKERLLEDIGRVREKLEANQKAKERFSKSIEELKRAKAELNKWERLHELIGSSDGKKFRNFAQGLTFDIMINFANTILEKMSDRYYLIRDKEKPLELNVVDAYQAGEVRSVKNLSGGESFIVSLSLAIGLSKMVSGKVKVDSLFLDEGFGTLDDDAMEIALSTLSTLQSEGKIIGIISHINTIKERIYNQIQLTPNANGTSNMSGVGVGKLKN